MYSLTQEQVDKVKAHWPEQANAIQKLGDQWIEGQCFWGSSNAINTFVAELKKQDIVT
jgi:hypothetical protein